MKIVQANVELVIEIVEENNYYPFGLKHKGYNTNVTSTNLAQNYKFGGKEYNEELGLDWYDVSARNYDPALGRWMNLDPLAELMTRHSPYNYAFDNPVYFIDPDGMNPVGYGMSPVGADGLTNEQWMNTSRPGGGGHDVQRAQAAANRNDKWKNHSCQRCKGGKVRRKKKQKITMLDDIVGYFSSDGWSDPPGNGRSNDPPPPGEKSNDSSMLGYIGLFNGSTNYIAQELTQRGLYQSKALSYVKGGTGASGYLLAGASIWQDKNALDQNQITPGRFGYRTMVNVGGIGLAAFGSGGWSLALSVLGLGSEMVYDGWVETIQPAMQTKMPNGGALRFPYY